jgi:ParB-like nuclease domain
MRATALPLEGDMALWNRARSDLLPLEEATRRLRPFARTNVGLRAIPVGRIVGTDSRGGDFDRDFKPRRQAVAERLRRVEDAFPDGYFPPIDVLQLGDAFFVLDGHHRVSSARRRGAEMIDAEVTELRSRWHLDADADIVELIHADQHQLFMKESGLGEVRPDVCMRVSRPAGYVELLENVQIHGYHLMLEAARVLEPAAIARDWYERVYRPAVEKIRREGLDRADPEATDADLFLDAYRIRRERFADCGCTSLGETARDVIQERESKRVGVRRLLGRAA